MTSRSSINSKRNVHSSGGGQRRILFPKLYESVDQKSPLFSHQVRTTTSTTTRMDHTHSKDHEPNAPIHSTLLKSPIDRDNRTTMLQTDAQHNHEKDSNTQRDIVQLMKEIDEIQTTSASENHSSSSGVHTKLVETTTIPIELHDHDHLVIRTPLNVPSDNNNENDHEMNNKSPTSTASPLDQKSSPRSTTSSAKVMAILPGKSILKKNKTSRSLGITPSLSHSSSSDNSLPETSTHAPSLHGNALKPSMAQEYYLTNNRFQLPLTIPLKRNDPIIQNNKEQQSRPPEKPKMLLQKSYSESFADTLQKGLSLSFSALALNDRLGEKLTLHKRGSFQDDDTSVHGRACDLSSGNVNVNEKKNLTSSNTAKTKPYIRKNSSGVLSTTSTASTITRHMSHEEMEQRKKIRFDPRVWVHEVQRPAVEKTWYSHSEIDRFKHEAIMRIRNWTLKRRTRAMSDEIIATGTGRVINRGAGVPFDKNLRALYTNPALRSDAEDEEDDIYIMNHRRRHELLREIRTVLIVDSHDIFLSLLAKDIKSMLPHVKVITAYTVQEAIHRMEVAKSIDGNECTHGFDLIVIEERLKQGMCRYRSISLPNNFEPSRTDPSSGSALIQKIAHQVESMSNDNVQDNTSDGTIATRPNIDSHRVPLVIGMSAYLQQDGKILKESGADIVWGKPPPKMDETLRNEILRSIMMKRNRSNIYEVFEH